MPPSNPSVTETNREPEDLVPRRWDRDWLRQLLRKHAHNHPNMPFDLVEKALVVVRCLLCMVTMLYLL
jgi:hypothetical protein